MKLSLESEAKEFVASKGYDPKFGARPLRRAIQQYIEDPLAEEILLSNFKEGSRIIAKYLEGSDRLAFVESDTVEESPAETEEKS
jgi:ATP-dependent Clp protease ATP-binding subunit ClpC